MINLFCMVQFQGAAQSVLQQQRTIHAKNYTIYNV